MVVAWAIGFLSVAAVLACYGPGESDLASRARSVAADPTSAGYLELSNAYYGQGFYMKSAEAARQAILFDPLNPNNARAHNNVCASYSALGRLEDAIEACEKALALDPAFQLARSNLSAVQEMMANLSPAQEMKAIDDADFAQREKRAAENPTSARYLNLSVAYYSSGLYQQSIEAGWRAVELDPPSANRARAYNNLCASYAALQNWDGAIEACEIALSVDSSLKLARNNLAWAKSRSFGQSQSRPARELEATSEPGEVVTGELE